MNVTSNGTKPEVGVPVKLAVGGTLLSAMLTVALLGAPIGTFLLILAPTLLSRSA